MDLIRSANEYFCLMICLLLCIAHFLSSNGFMSTYRKLPFIVQLILTVEEKSKAEAKNPNIL